MGRIPEHSETLVTVRAQPPTEKSRAVVMVKMETGVGLADFTGARLGLPCDVVGMDPDIDTAHHPGPLHALLGRQQGPNPWLGALSLASLGLQRLGVVQVVLLVIGLLVEHGMKKGGDEPAL